MTMNIQIHRGQDQIGGNLIEISDAYTRIMLDVGCELEGDGNAPLPDIPGLFDYKGFDAVFISHYHGDHMGLVGAIHQDIPFYIGEGANRVTMAADAYLGQITRSPAGFLHDRQGIVIGSLTITSFLCDHSAFDSYMLLVEGDGEKILYTGDFRANGRKSFERLLQSLPQVDTLICEGTTLSRFGEQLLTEQDLEEQAVNLFRENVGPVFVLQSSTNIDRVVTMYRASKRSGRLFLNELYMAGIMTAAGESIPNPKTFSDVRVFITRAYENGHWRRELFNRFGKQKIGRSAIAGQHFTMCVRTSMGNYLRSLNKELSFEGGLLIYSMWDGYRNQENMRRFLEECGRMGLMIVPLHTTGHADAETITCLIDHTQPRCIMPIHTENAAWFKGFADTSCAE